MRDHIVNCLAVVVALPDEFDAISREQAYDRLYAAFASGAAVVIADLTATSFCDSASLRRLVSVQNRAAAQDAQLRLLIPPDGPVRRVANLIDLGRRIPIYSSLPAATRPLAPRPSHPGDDRVTACPASAIRDMPPAAPARQNGTQEHEGLSMQSIASPGTGSEPSGDPS